MVLGLCYSFDLKNDKIGQFDKIKNKKMLFKKNVNEYKGQNSKIIDISLYKSTQN